MIQFPKKRVFGLIGAPRSGKDTVANYLQETRNFAPMAFADRIKLEFGISNADFEAAKIAGNIEKLRQELWDFSAQKKANDPAYFIRLVMEEAVTKKESVVITDIRTEDEFNALFEYLPANIIARVYCIVKDHRIVSEDDTLEGSKLKYEYLWKAHKQDKIRNIFNDVPGVYGFYKKLDNYFFTEDIMDLSDSRSENYSDRNEMRSMVSDYVSHFDVREA